MNSTAVIIHGYGFDQRIWSPVELAFDRFRLVRLSLPGFGAHEGPGPYTIQSLAGQYWSQLDADGIGGVHLVGHSMGGYVCMEMAAQKPERVLSLALVHSHVFADTEEKKLQRSDTMKRIEEEGREFLVRKMIPSLFADQVGLKPLIDVLVDRGMKYADAAWLYGAQAMRDRNDHSTTLRTMMAPVLMVMGDKDIAVPLELAYRQAGISSRATLHIYPDSGHMAMYENTSRLICDLVSFYNSL